MRPVNKDILTSFCISFMHTESRESSIIAFCFIYIHAENRDIIISVCFSCIYTEGRDRIISIGLNYMKTERRDRISFSFSYMHTESIDNTIILFQLHAYRKHRQHYHFDSATCSLNAGTT